MLLVRFGSELNMATSLLDVRFTKRTFGGAKQISDLGQSIGHSDHRVAELVHRDLRTGHTI
jgi:hypothetical protein